MNLHYALDLLPLAIGIGVGILIVGAVFIIVMGRRDGYSSFSVIAGFMFAIIAMMAAVVTVGLGEVARTEAHEQWMEDTYGIQFSAAQYAELEFPTFAAPDHEREVYGLTTGNRDNQLVTVQLVWQDDQFVLIGDDGEQLDALATR